MDTKRFLIFIVIFRVVLFVFRSWVQGGRCISKARLDGKVAVITGANTGIGRETARDLVKRGAEVHLLCRDLEKAEIVKGEIKTETGREVFVHKVDLASLESVKECAAVMKKELQKIDILINNAGIMATLEKRTQEGFELQFGTNHVGHFLLTNELLPLLRNAGKSRVVVLSSSAHTSGKINFDDLNWRTRTYSPLAAYSQSKLANVLFAKELARRETQLESGVTVYCLHPGVIKTELFRHVKETYGYLLYLLGHVLMPFYKTVESGAQTSIFCAVEESLENVTGKYYKDCKEVDASKDGNNMEDAKKLWEVTEDMVHKKD
eukprot:GFUD01009196.1.p1 GENE.GFUD01009196.1~~GFUD01009196.1.p1  ORF type:complete len:321 (+),score=108.94 GFUD01009196.1:106-1068(+)